MLIPMAAAGLRGGVAVTPPTFVSIGTFVASASAPTAGTPASIQTDDVLILAVPAEGCTLPHNPPSGGEWTQITTTATSTVGADDAQLTAFYHVYDGVTLPNLTLPDDGAIQAGQVIAIRGAASSGVLGGINAESATGSSAQVSSLSHAGPTTTADGCLIVALVAGSENIEIQDYTGTGNVESLTLRDSQGTGIGNDLSFSVATGTLSTAGAVGTLTCPIAAFSMPMCGLIIALEPG